MIAIIDFSLLIITLYASIICYAERYAAIIDKIDAVLSATAIIDIYVYAEAERYIYAAPFCYDECAHLINTCRIATSSFATLQLPPPLLMLRH